MTREPVGNARQQRGPSIARLGVAGLVGAVAITLVAWILIDDLFDRFGISLDVTGEALVSVGTTLDVADEALGTLISSLHTAAVAAGHASASSQTVGAAVSETVIIVGEDLPASIDAIRDAMPALIEASNVIDNTLSALAFIGVPYNPEVPLDEAFAELDLQLAPLPGSLRDNAEIISNLIPEADGFHQETVILIDQIEMIRLSVVEARSVIDDYRSQTVRLDAVVRETSEGLDQGAYLSRLLVVLGGALAVIAMSGLIAAGRAITALEQLPR
ncbi:MAG TPA: hypothetical protein VM848_00905 [Acidimicrobiia bacterium]|nr:hypothetical protein [Acidimicrobiia bacterium]